MSLLFAPGDRPSIGEIEVLLSSMAMAGSMAQITYRPGEERGWIELLVNGLTFDLTGLVPAPPTSYPEPRRTFGLPEDVGVFEFEGISLLPGAHIAAGGAMLPIVRVMVGLVANLALNLPVKTVCWHPTGSWMDVRYFARLVLGWLAGGAFPALGLCGVERRFDGSFVSVGLGFFIGKEILIEAAFGEAQTDTIKLAVRVIDHLITCGHLDQAQALRGPAGQPLLIEPMDRQLIVRRAV